MRQTLPSARADLSKGFSIPPPVGGWNARDPLANMSEKDAIYLENWVPQANSLEVRKGCLQTGQVAGTEVRTLIPYSSTAGSKKLIAACADGLYDITTALTDSAHTYAAPTHALVSTPFWQHLNVATAGGSFLMLVNGAQNPVLYNGTTFTNLTGTSTPSLSGTGLTLSTLINVSLFKGRMIFVAKDSLSFWYGAPNAVAGTLTEFPLAVLFRKGGYLVATASWTLDSGAGPEDRFVAITSEGEVAVYQGTDPANASTWALVGIFEMARPLGYRCICKVGPDLAVLTEDGILSLAKALPSSTPARSAALSDKIGPAFRDFVSLYKTLPGWDIHYMASEGLLFINVPDPVGATQLVMNTITGAWTRFTGWAMSSLCVCDSKLYFAAKNLVFHALYGAEDNTSTINIKAKTAFLGKGSKFQRKHVKLVRLNLTASSQVSLKLGLDADYTNTEFSSSVASYGDSSPKWDSARWDQARWDIDTVQAKWRSVAHMPGSALALRISAQLRNISLTWNAIDFIVAAGGLL